MKFIMKQGKTDKDIHSLRQEIEVSKFQSLIALTINFNPNQFYGI